MIAFIALLFSLCLLLSDVSQPGWVSSSRTNHESSKNTSQARNVPETFTQIRGLELHVLPPVLDLRADRVIRIFALKPLYNQNLYCHVKYNDSKTIRTGKALIFVKLFRVGEQCRWYEAIIECPLKNTRRLNPTHVMLAASEGAHQWLPIRHQTFVPPESPKYGICLSTMFDLTDKNLPHILEWFEMQKILGVHNVILYGTDNVSLLIKKALKIYINSGFLIFMNWSLPKRSSTLHRKYSGKRDGDCIYYFAQYLIHNDCLYSYGDSFTHLAFLDSDEYVIPKTNKWKVMIDALEDIERSQNASCASYAFQEACFPNNAITSTDRESGENVASHLSTRSTQRLPKFRYAEDSGSYIKSIVKPSQVVHMDIHVVLRPLPEMCEKFRVPLFIAQKNHYRKYCGPDLMLVSDDIMSRYQDRLMHGVKRALAMMDL